MRQHHGGEEEGRSEAASGTEQDRDGTKNMGTASPLTEILAYGWTGQQSGSGFSDLAPSILHYNWF
jgi:hypothetical protein